MTRKLTPVTRHDLIKRFKKLGWEGPRRGSNHDFMVKGTQKLRIPNPHRRSDIGVSLLDTILKQAGVSRDEWFESSD